MTVGSSAVLIMLFVLKHKFTMTAAADLVNMLVAHLPEKHKVFTSLYRFYKIQCETTKYMLNNLLSFVDKRSS